MPVILLPDNNKSVGPVLIMTNTCDINPENKRYHPPYVFYCPIIKLSKYEDSIKEMMNGQQLGDHISSIKRQEISSMLFLPRYSSIMKVDAIALLDRIVSYDIDYLTQDILKDNRLFSLSDFGFYIFLIKVSIHMTRIRENIDRKNGIIH